MGRTYTKEQSKEWGDKMRAIRKENRENRKNSIHCDNCGNVFDIKLAVKDFNSDCCPKCLSFNDESK